MTRRSRPSTATPVTFPRANAAACDWSCSSARRHCSGCSQWPAPAQLTLTPVERSLGSDAAGGTKVRSRRCSGRTTSATPVQLIRHAGKGSLELIAHEALALTKMDWNNDALYDPVPVSIRYSQRLARTIANVQDLPRSVYPYRLFM